MPNDLPLADHDLDLDHAVCFLRLLWFKNINSSEVISAKVKDKKNQNIIYEVLFGIVGIVHVVFRKISLKSLFLLEIEPTFYSNFSLIHFFFIYQFIMELTMTFTTHELTFIRYRLCCGFCNLFHDLLSYLSEKNLMRWTVFTLNSFLMMCQTFES